MIGARERTVCRTSNCQRDLWFAPAGLAGTRLRVAERRIGNYKGCTRYISHFALPPPTTSTWCPPAGPGGGRAKCDALAGRVLVVNPALRWGKPSGGVYSLTGSILLTACLCLAASCPAAMAQVPLLHHGEVVPRDVREIYDRGLQYLANKQTENGDWSDGQNGPGTTGMALMAFVASGEDPNFGRYRNHVRRAVRSIISAQDGSTGYLGNSMYHHGFGMLALAEAYGAVDDRDLWSVDAPAKADRRPFAIARQSSKGRTIGAALELAVRGCHFAKEEPEPRLALLARCCRCRHVRQRRGAGGAVGGPQRRHRGPGYGD